MAAAKPAPVAVTLPTAPSLYDRANEQQARQAIEQSFQKCVASQPAVIITGAKGGNTALASVIALLVQLGYAVDQTT